MIKLSVYNLAEIIDGKIINDRVDMEISRFNIYASFSEENDAFFALNGQKYSNTDGGLGFSGDEDSVFSLGGVKDGHNELALAINNGAKHIIIDNSEFSLISREVNIILVDDVLEALTKLSRYILDIYGTKVIGITGSTGKTTLTHSIYQFLSKHYKVSKLEYIRTSYLGVILHILFCLDSHDDFLIIEMQVDKLGQINKFCEITKLDFAFITMINNSHLGRFTSITEITQEKLSIYYNLKEDGILFIDIENKILYEWFKLIENKNIITIGTKNAKFYAKNITHRGFYNLINFDLYENNNFLKNIEVNLPGQQYIKVALFLAALSSVLNINIEDMNDSIQSLETIVGRFQCFKGVNNSFVIVDSYNASMDSMINGLDYISSLRKNKKIFIVGSLLELNGMCEKIHRDIGKAILAKKNIDYVIAFGENALYIVDELKYKYKYNCNLFHSFTYEKVINIINKLNIDDDTAVYIKGSGVMRMEIIAVHLLSNKMF